MVLSWVSSHTLEPCPSPGAATPNREPRQSRWLISLTLLRLLMSIGQCYMARQAPDKLEWHLANEIPFERCFSSFEDRLMEGHTQDVILPFRFLMVNPSFFR